MRKALAVLVLAIGSVLVLQAPAFAQHLYKISQTGSVFESSSLHADYEILTNCPTTVTVRSTTFMPPAATPRFRGTLKVRRNENDETWRRLTFSKVVDSAANARAPKNLRATCAGDHEPMTAVPGALAFTGVSLLPQLVVGTGFLLVGVLLIVSSRRRPSRMTAGS
jgi:hypothetical protein